MEPVTTPRVLSGRYELTHQIARGGMAQVYRARDRQLDRPVALKVLFPELSVDRAFVERFRREAQAAANLSHPNIVPVYDWGEDDGAYFIVMEFIDGRPLSAVLREGDKLSPQQIATVGANVAAALAFAHRHGVVHRDVKPGNVLITKDGQVKVTDFGIARAVNTEDSLTQTGAVMGTAAYFSPEQAEGHGVDSRSDIYSLGVVLYEMTTGKPPFTGDSPVAVASKHVREQPALPRSVNPDIPPALESVVMKAMAKSPDARYQSAEELRADLLRFADGRPVEAGDATTAMAAGVTTTVAAVGATEAVMITGQTQAVSPIGVTRADVQHQRRTRALLAALVALLLILGVVAYFVISSVTPGSVSVPSVRGQTPNGATQMLQADGLKVGTSPTHRTSASVISGLVITTSPGPGTSVSKNSTVNLIISSGPTVTFVNVPNVVNSTLTAAEQTLSSPGVNLSYKVNFITSTKPQGTVLQQNPAGGSRVKSTTVVQLTVSSQQNLTSVPSVLGNSPATAGQLLANSNLKVGTQTMQCSSQFGSGLVAGQTPAADAQVPPNTPVDLVISSGDCVSVPSIVGDTPSAASSALSSAGLVAGSQTVDGTCNNGQAAPGTVDSQTPAANAQVSSGSTVNMTVCQTGATTTTGASTTTTTTGQGAGNGGGGGGLFGGTRQPSA